MDSLSTATDNYDNHRTISKFPKTRSLKFISKQDENGQEIALIANYVNIFAAPKCVFFILVFFSNFFSILSGDLYRYYCTFNSNVKNFIIL